MKKTAIYLILILTITGCRTQNEVSKNSIVQIDFIELGYGICTVKTLTSEKMENTPTGTHNVSTNFKLIEKTDRIPIKIGQQFGVDYLLKSDIYTEIPVEFVWTFPESITNENGEVFKEIKYTRNVSTNENNHSTYTLNENYLLVKGEWKYEVLYKGKKIYQRKFYLE
ncbi:MAG: DUF3859 domain-containing protein [Leeuwenhoekiella sp.]